MRVFLKLMQAASRFKAESVFFIFLLMPLLLFAQARTITGTVTDGDTQESLPGATIVLKGSTAGTVSDINGKFSISIKDPANAILVFSFVGYTTLEVPIESKTVINVTLQPAKIKLQEIVVIGYGTVKKSDLTGSVGSIKSEDLTKITAPDVVQSLQGKVTGVQVTTPSGNPGDVPVVRIRGVGTFNNTAPIYVVDGVILDDISFLNSADIKSMEVLKDASATAIYGSRGANGVIIVTTKTGTGLEGKTDFTFSAETGIQNIAKKIKLLSGRDYASYINEIEPTYNNIDVVPNTDWQKLIFHTAPVYNYQLSAAGATKMMDYYIGGSYYKQEGIIDKSNYTRITIKLNNTYKMTSFFKLGNNITITPFTQQIAPNVTYQAYRAKPLLEPYYSDGSFAAVDGVGNPLADLSNSNNYRKGIRGVGNIFGELTFLKSFILKTSFGVDAEYDKSENFTPAYKVLEPNGTESQQVNLFSTLFKGTNDRLNWLWENTLTYTKDIKKHSIDAVVGYTMQNSTSENTGITGSNILRNGRNFWYIIPNYIYNESIGINNLDENKLYDKVDADNFYSMISFLCRVNYTYAKKYIFTATFRRDGSSKFASKNRYSNFPSFALGWNIANESFMKNIKLLNTLKLRASWGKIGNDKITYTDRYSLVDNSLISIFGTSGYGSANAAASYGLKGNPNLKWEVTTQTDAGLEVGVLNSRLTGEFDYYNRQTDDILVLLSTPGYFGNGSGQKVRYNAASVLNRGFEFNINWRDQINKLKYSVGILGSFIHNEVLKIGGSSGVDSVLYGGNLSNGIAVTASRVGLPIGAFYGFKTDGIFQNQAELDAYPHMSDAGVGDLRFVDVNGDGKIDGNDRTYIGSPIPKFIFGFNINLEYSGFDLSINVQGQTGNKIFNAKDCVRPDPYNYEEYVKDHWTGEGTSTTQPRASKGGYNYTPSDYFIQDGSFMRLRNITLGYTLPGNLSNKIYMKKIRVYLKADNLYTWTKYTGYTPEIGSSDVLGNGIDDGVYPITAVYAIGLNLNF
ncbi:MAG: TonB-dependent receptor [Bacteroidota bacterium]|nr:TonB-dependent receptor [Bacteroidota bacterium]